MFKLVSRLLSKTKKDGVLAHVQALVKESKEAGTYKRERVITSQQKSAIMTTEKDEEVLNFCANNYLGLSNHPSLISAATKGLQKYGLGMSSVRFICGTQDIHKQLEKKLSDFHSAEDTILYSSAFDANGGFFEGVTNEEDTIISDALNHASIIDGIRLAKSKKFRYEHMNLKDLERILKECAGKSRNTWIVTDGVFSMDGDVAELDKLVELKHKYKAHLFVDDSHATGFFGKRGRGTPEHFGVTKEIDITNSTLGKALGGASGGYTTGRADCVELLRQKSRPYLFSNSLAPPIVCSTIAALDMLTQSTELRDKLMENTTQFRSLMKAAGFKVLGNDVCPIAPIFFGDARIAGIFAEEMMKENIYVIAFSFPVVPKGQARIRVQLSAGHSSEQIDKTVEAFTKIGKKLNVI